ncbi:hypothetical protein [Streptomyces sp. SudanB52_2052]|uniref:hypothetical protein n=1 Tax=Streptomyces sp. SudanB52_2052 TaxID=3035276 RepID=UPI003F556300
MAGSPDRRRREVLLLAAGTVLGAAVGALTNLVTATWNWWLFGALLLLVTLAALRAALVPGGSPAAGDSAPVTDPTAGAMARTHCRRARRCSPAVTTSWTGC